MLCSAVSLQRNSTPCLCFWVTFGLCWPLSFQWHLSSPPPIHFIYLFYFNLAHSQEGSSPPFFPGCKCCNLTPTAIQNNKPAQHLYWSLSWPSFKNPYSTYTVYLQCNPVPNYSCNFSGQMGVALHRISQSFSLHLMQAHVVGEWWSASTTNPHKTSLMNNCSPFWYRDQNCIQYSKLHIVFQMYTERFPFLIWLFYFKSMHHYGLELMVIPDFQSAPIRFETKVISTTVLMA